MTDSEDSSQQPLDLYREMNRYDGRDEDWPSDEVFEPPRRTLHNYWRKYHAARDCGSDRVALVEELNSRSTTDRYEYDLRCLTCGHGIDEDEVLFLGGDWYSRHGSIFTRQSLDNFRLPNDRVLELGPDPDREDLEHALELTRIEREAGFHGVSFGNERRDECEDCGRETMLRFDRRCRMCYDGEWTDRMQTTVKALAISVRERNHSFVHRLEQHVDPLAIGDRAYEGQILWRRHAGENVSKLVEVKQCLQDDSDGHWEYILTDPTHTEVWRYHEDDVADCFWDTGLRNDEHPKAVMDDRIRDLWNRVNDR